MFKAKRRISVKVGSNPTLGCFRELTDGIERDAKMAANFGIFHLGLVPSIKPPLVNFNRCLKKTGYSI